METDSQNYDEILEEYFVPLEKPYNSIYEDCYEKFEKMANNANLQTNLFPYIPSLIWGHYLSSIFKVEDNGRHHEKMLLQMHALLHKQNLEREYAPFEVPNLTLPSNLHQGIPSFTLWSGEKTLLHNDFAYSCQIQSMIESPVMDPCNFLHKTHDRIGKPLSCIPRGCLYYFCFYSVQISFYYRIPCYSIILTDLLNNNRQSVVKFIVPICKLVTRLSRVGYAPSMNLFPGVSACIDSEEVQSIQTDTKMLRAKLNNRIVEILVTFLYSGLKSNYSNKIMSALRDLCAVSTYLALPSGILTTHSLIQLIQDKEYL